MDKINRAIVAELQKNSRKAFLEIAKSLGVSEGTIRNRVGKLVKHGVIKRFTVELGGVERIMAIIAVRTSANRNTPNLSRQIKAISPNIESVYETSGNFDVFAIVACESIGEFNTLLERIRNTKGVIETQTYMVLGKA
ncbi:hypothetical protein AUJ14_00025 [Candidatus Micrarchaeota archaeon CG1_02_55_22]|nr:MAG: hypothetical protein AUJ14_00025 [Candidatus Micrarchaeota archaeon CG1_02_55_22]